MEFKEGDKEHFVEIEILYDGQREMREAFTVHMKPDDNMVAEIQVTAHSYKCAKIARQQLALLSVRLNHSAL